MLFDLNEAKIHITLNVSVYKWIKVYLEWQNARLLTFLSIIGAKCVYFSIFYLYFLFTGPRRMEWSKIINYSKIYFSFSLTDELLKVHQMLELHVAICRTVSSDKVSRQHRNWEDELKCPMRTWFAIWETNNHCTCWSK